MKADRRHPLSAEIDFLRYSLRSLDRSLRRFAWVINQLDGKIERRRKPRPASRRVLSTKARASLVLQGRYMGYMRQLKTRQKARVRQIREAKGVRVAIAKARELAGA